MKLIIIIFIALFVAKILMSADERAENSSQGDYNLFADSGLESYGKQGTLNSWPDLDSGRDTGLASDLMVANYYVVIDGSGSMSGADCVPNSPNKMYVATKALDNFFDKLPAESNVGVYAFDRKGNSERLTLGNHSSDRAMKAVHNVVLGGGTPLSLAIDHGFEALTNQARKQLGYGEYHLVIVTDGEASPGYEPDSSVERLLKNSPIVLHTIGFCIADDHSLNMPGYTVYKSADNPQALAKGLESVLAESPDFNVDEFRSEI